MRALPLIKLIPLSVLVIACDTPGTGGRSGRIPVTLTQGGDATSTASDSASGTATATAPDDATSPDEDTATTTTVGDTAVAPDTDNPDTTAPTCGVIPLSGTISGWTLSDGGIWESPAVNLGIGGSGPEQAALRLADGSTGTFDLADEPPGACTHCVVFSVDGGDGAGELFAADAGTLIVDQDPVSGLDVTLYDAHFIALSLSGAPAGGACLTLGEVRATGVVACQPECGDRDCGDDGCGGACGACGGTQTCNASGQCVGGTTTGCTTVALGATIDPMEPQIFQADISAAGLGAGDPDYLALQFYAGDTGAFDLGSGDNANFATCLQCILVFEDTPSGAAANRLYFQTKGTMTVGAASDVLSDPPSLSASLSGVELREVTIDSGTYTSTLVPNGKCLKLQNRSIATP